MGILVLLQILGCLCFFGVCGYFVGGMRGKAAAGALLGAVLGPLGWAIILMSADTRLRCHDCQERLDHPQAKRCPHCGTELHFSPEQLHGGYDPADPELSRRLDEESAGPPALAIPIIGGLVIVAILTYTVLRMSH